MFPTQNPVGQDPSKMAPQNGGAQRTTATLVPPAFTKAGPPPSASGDTASADPQRKAAPPKSKRDLRKMVYITDFSDVPDKVSIQDPAGKLQDNLGAVKRAMTSTPVARSTPARVDMSYADACGLHGNMSQAVGSRRVTGMLHREWIEINDPTRAADDPAQPAYLGDKIHLSINRAQLDDAFPVVLGILCAEGTPLRSMKMTNLAYVDRLPEASRTSASAMRVTDGAQFTLYIHPQEDGYTAEHLSKLADTVRQIEGALHAAGIMPGVLPDSDAPMGSFATYRHEHHSDRGEDKDNQKINSQEPVYQCLMARQAGL